jgi:hypothetical protein
LDCGEKQKMKLQLNSKRKIKKTICGQEFTLTQYITSEQKSYIIEKILDYYNEIKEETLSSVVCDLRANFDVLILLSTTDIEINKDDQYDDMIASGLIDLIRKSVINYDEVYQDTFYVVQVTRLASLFPDTSNLFDSIKELPEMFEKMSPEQKENLELVLRASLANSVSNTNYK